MAKRQIPCSCRRIKVRENKIKRSATTAEGWFPWMPVGIRNILTEATKVFKTITTTKTVAELLESDNRECKICKGTGYIEDPTDTQEEDQKAAELAKSKAEEFQKLEAELGPPGGNRHVCVVGDQLVEVGLGFNDVPSYEILEDKGAAQRGLAITKEGVVPIDAKTSIIRGTNPLSTSGGHYVIKCSNKFTLYVGSQGIELNTTGPICLRGGITQIYGPEVSLGSSVGQTLIEGKHLQLSGKTINITPDPSSGGQVNVQGTLTTNGNFITQGGAHIEGDLSFISATCPTKLERTRFSGQADQVTGHAVWSAQATLQATMDFTRKWQVFTTDPSFIALSPRGVINLLTDTLSLANKMLPVEPVQTGIALVYGTPMPVFNFPHHHVLPDMIHAHDIIMPNIRGLDDSEAVRRTASLKETIVPVNAHKDSSIFELFETVGNALRSLATMLIPR